MSSLATEQMRIFFLGDRHELVLDEQIHHGSETEVKIRSRDIVKHAFDLDCSALVLAHNHPSGDHRPSTQDSYFTRNFVSMCKMLEIAVLDHIIVSRNGMSSFVHMGLM